MRSLYAQFKRDPEGSVVVSTNSEVAVLYGLEWCFFRKLSALSANRLGFGADILIVRSKRQRNRFTLVSLGWEQELSPLDPTLPTSSNRSRPSITLETNWLTPTIRSLLS